MGVMKSGINLLSFGFSLLFIASMADFFIHPAHMYPADVIGEFDKAVLKAERKAARKHKQRAKSETETGFRDDGGCLFDPRLKAFVHC